MGLDEAYEVLGLRPGADEAAVRSAYRARAKRDHPDRGGSQQAFIRTETAYRCISGAGFPPPRPTATHDVRTHPHPADRSAPHAVGESDDAGDPAAVDLGDGRRARARTYLGAFLLLSVLIVLVGLGQNTIRTDSGTVCGWSIDLVMGNADDAACGELRSRHLGLTVVAGMVTLAGAWLFSVGVTAWWCHARDEPNDRPFADRVRQRVIHIVAYVVIMQLWSTYCRPAT